MKGDVKVIGGTQDLDDFNNEISSVYAVKGNWMLYDYKNAHKNKSDLKPYVICEGKYEKDLKKLVKNGKDINFDDKASRIEKMTVSESNKYC